MARYFVYTGDFGDVASSRVGRTDDINAMPTGSNITWLSGAGAPTDGAAGTGVNVAGRGSFYTDIDTGVTYIQLGAITNVEWHGILLA